MVELPAAGIPTDYAAIWASTDGVGGNITVQGTGLFVGSLSTCAFSVFGRSSSATNPFGTNCYEAQLYGDSGGTGQLIFNRYQSGGQTALVILAVSAISLNLWYQVAITLNVSAITITLQRLSDGYYCNSSGNFISSVTTAISATDSAVTGSGYSGWAAVTGGSSAVYGDDWYLIGLSAPAVPPKIFTVGWSPNPHDEYSWFPRPVKTSIAY
jgi:hypothetical protein